LPVLEARSLVNVAIPQCCGGYVATKAMRTMVWLLVGIGGGSPRRTVAGM